jgi:hypothetical protein
VVKQVADNVTVLSTVCHSTLSSEEMKRIRYVCSDRLRAKSAVLEESSVEDNKYNLCLLFRIFEAINQSEKGSHY